MSWADNGKTDKIHEFHQHINWVQIAKHFEVWDSCLSTNPRVKGWIELEKNILRLYLDTVAWLTGPYFIIWQRDCG